MFSKIWNYLVNVEQTVEHDVEAIISTFTNTITKLEDAVAAKNAEAAAHDEIAGLAHQAASAARQDAKRAYDVAGKIKDLVA
jgi:hypothetical protein